jgi:hypothetical protein
MTDSTGISAAGGDSRHHPPRLHPARLCTAALLVSICLLLGAGTEDWLIQRMAVLAFDSQASSYLLLHACPDQDLSAFMSLSYRQPGTVLDTVGINAAPQGAWNMSIDAAGQLSFAIYSPRRTTAFEMGNGWQRYSLPASMHPGREYNLVLDIDNGNLIMILFEGDEEAGYLHETLPCALASSEVYAGDYPLDDDWGQDYNIHPSFQGDLQVLYFGPQIDDLTPDNIALTWVNPALQYAANQPDEGDVYVTTEQDILDWNQLPEVGELPDDMFTLDYGLADESKGHYSQSDCLEALLSASPFYGGASGGPGVRTQEIDRLRVAKVEEIVDLATQLPRNVAALQPELRRLEASYASMLQIGLAMDPSLDPYVIYTLQELAGMKAQAENALDLSEGLSRLSGDPLADANMQYLSVTHSMLLAGLCLKQADSLCLFSSLPQGEFSQSTDIQLVRAAAEMEQALQQYDELAPQLERLAYQMAAVDCGLQQLEAADYYIGMAGLEFMGKQLPELQQQLDLVTELTGLSAGELAEARRVLRYNTLMHGVLKDQLAAAPAPELIAQAQERNFPQPCGTEALLQAAAQLLGPQTAWAAEQKLPSIRDLAISMKSIRDVADLPRDPDNPTIGESIKQAYRSFNSDINKVLDFKNARKQWGKGVDSAGAYMHSKAREGMGWWYGNTPEEIEKDITDNYDRIAKNQSEGREGSETYRTAKKYMEDTENMADEAAKDFIAKTFGGKLTPWIAGKIAKGLTSVFTGLAKGIYAIADPSSTPGEMAVGIAEIALAGTAGNAVAYESSLAGFKNLLTKALGFGSMKECLNVVLDQYKENLGKELLGSGIDGKSVLEAFVSFIGVEPGMLEDFSYDGNYEGKLSGGAGGKIWFTIQGSTWQGGVSGSFAWTMEGTDISGVSEFSGSLFGTFNPANGALSGELAGSVGKNRFSGPISGSVVRDVGAACVARGNWVGSDKIDTLQGQWTANRQ